MTSLRFSVCVLAALLAAGCSDSTTPTSATATATTAFTFASSFTTRGSASRSFEQLATGAVDLTLRAASPDVRLGIGLGIPRPDGSGCNLTRGVEVSMGEAPQLTLVAEPGVWCVRVYDVGFVPERVAFTLEVSHF
jgi:hypothetical protein